MQTLVAAIKTEWVFYLITFSNQEVRCKVFDI